MTMNGYAAKARTVAAVYTAAGLLWILFSDRLLQVWISNGELWARLQSVKGSAFVLVSGLLLYMLAHRALRALGESEVESKRRTAAFQSLIETLPDAVTILEADGTVRYVSPAFERITGYSPSERLGKSALGRVHPDDLEMTNREFARLARTPGARASIRPRIRHKDGSWKVVRLGGCNLTESPAVRGIVVTYSDVTRRVRAEDELRESEERFRLMVEGSEQVFFYEHDEEGRFLYLSPSIKQVLGYDPEELVDRPYSVLLTDHPSDPEVHRYSEQALRSGSRSEPYIAITRHKDGRIVALELIERPLVEGDVVRGLQGFARDITKRLDAERDLRQSETRFRSLIEHSSDTVTVVDRQGVIRFQSSSVRRLIGVGPAELVGRSAMRGIHPEDRPDVREAFRVLKEDGDGAIRELEFRCRAEDGKWRVIEATAHNRLSDPAIGGVVVNARDVTASRAMEERFRQVQKMEAVGRLAGGVAHDFNNILTAMKGHVDLLLQDLPDEGEWREDVAEIGRSASRAADLTRQLLAFSRQQVLRPRVVDLNSVISDVRGMLDRLIGENIHLGIDLQRGLSRIKADPGQIQQVIMNLVVNARDAMPGGGNITLATTAATISVSEARAFPYRVLPGPYVLLTVQDEGEGMDELTLEHAFDPFYTTKGPGKGTGLGLSTVYGIVKQSGGYIWVDSEPGRGTTFRMYLPVAEVEEDSRDGTVASQPRAVDNRAAGRYGTVLVVEDEEPVRKLIQRVLSRDGCRASVAASGREALEWIEARSGAVDIVLTDVVMPDMGGVELGRKIQAAYPHVRLVFMSGYTEDEMVRGGELLPDVPLLEKPFSPPDLTATLRRTLASRGSEPADHRVPSGVPERSVR